MDYDALQALDMLGKNIDSLGTDVQKNRQAKAEKEQRKATADFIRESDVGGTTQGQLGALAVESGEKNAITSMMNSSMFKDQEMLHGRLAEACMKGDKNACALQAGIIKNSEDWYSMKEMTKQQAVLWRKQREAAIGGQSGNVKYKTFDFDIRWAAEPLKNNFKTNLSKLGFDEDQVQDIYEMYDSDTGGNFIEQIKSSAYGSNASKINMALHNAASDTVDNYSPYFKNNGELKEALFFTSVGGASSFNEKQARDEFGNIIKKNPAVKISIPTRDYLEGTYMQGFGRDSAKMDTESRTEKSAKKKNKPAWARDL